MQQLGRDYFEANEDITDRNVLIASGVKAGLEGMEVRDWMESDRGGAEVDRDVAEAREKLSGVPNFTIASR